MRVSKLTTIVIFILTASFACTGGQKQNERGASSGLSEDGSVLIPGLTLEDGICNDNARLAEVLAKIDSDISLKCGDKTVTGTRAPSGNDAQECKHGDSENCVLADDQIAIDPTQLKVDASVSIEELAECSSLGDEDCIATSRFVDSIQCSEKNKTDCFARGDFVALNHNSLNASEIKQGVVIAGVTGTYNVSESSSYNECETNGETGCIATTEFQAADLTNLSESNVKIGVSLAGVTGTHDTDDCTSDGEIGCKTTASFKAADMSQVIATNIKDDITIAGVEGTLTGGEPNCSSDGQTSCVATASYPAMDVSLATTSGKTNICMGSTLGGVKGLRGCYSQDFSMGFSTTPSTKFNDGSHQIYESSNSTFYSQPAFSMSIQDPTNDEDAMDGSPDSMSIKLYYTRSTSASSECLNGTDLSADSDWTFLGNTTDIENGHDGMNSTYVIGYSSSPPVGTNYYYCAVEQNYGLRDLAGNGTDLAPDFNWVQSYYDSGISTDNYTDYSNKGASPDPITYYHNQDTWGIYFSATAYGDGMSGGDSVQESGLDAASCANSISAFYRLASASAGAGTCDGSITETGPWTEFPNSPYNSNTGHLDDPGWNTDADYHVCVQYTDCSDGSVHTSTIDISAQTYVD